MKIAIVGATGLVGTNIINLCEQYFDIDVEYSLFASKSSEGKNLPTKEDVNGAMNHFLFLNLSKIWTSNICAVKNAIPEPNAILKDIKSAKSVENRKVKPIPIKKPKYTILLATIFP